MNPVVHFEMAAEDKARMSKFYTDAFGWKTQQLGAEFGDYVMVQTDETDAEGMLKKTNRINGGFYQKGDDEKANAPSVVISVEDISAHIEKVKAAGGTVQGEPMDIPGIGTYVSILDTEGNRVGMLQPIESMN